MLSEREMDRADGQKQKHAKRASKEMRFHRGAIVRFHPACSLCVNIFYLKRIKDVETFCVLRSVILRLPRFD